MIVIRDVGLSLVGALDDELGYSWRDGALPEGLLEGCVDVTLSDSAIMKAYSDGTIILDIGGNKTFLPSGGYREVTIT